jgi:hypothetical protein
MKQLSTDRKTVLDAYRNADSNEKKLLKRLFGEEVFSEKITDRVKTLEDCYEETGRPVRCPEFNEVPKEWREYFKAQYDAIVIAEALNEGWVADYNDGDQQKWFPWFCMLSSSGFAFLATHCVCSYPSAGRAARLCFKDEKTAQYAGKTFTKVYEKIITK